MNTRLGIWGTGILILAEQQKRDMLNFLNAAHFR